MAMRPFPTRKIRRLIRELVGSIEEAPRLGFRARVEGVWDVDRDGELGLRAKVEAALPTSVPADGELGVGVQRRFESSSDGYRFVEVWRDPPTDPEGGES